MNLKNKGGSTKGTLVRGVSVMEERENMVGAV